MKKLKINKEKILGLFKKRLKLHLFLRTALVLGVIAILLFSLYTLGNAYQKKEEKTETEFNYSYTKEGAFNQVIYLENNTIYDDADELPPGGKAFRNIIREIESFFNFTYSSSSESDISLSYKLEAVLQTDLWTKIYTVKSIEQVQDTGRRLEFSVPFTLDYSTYEGIYEAINSETGVTAANPTLIYQCKIFGNAKIKGDTIQLDYTPSISLPLNGKTIEITKGIANSQAFSDIDRSQVQNMDVVNEKNYWTNITIAIFILLIIIILITRPDTEAYTEFDLEVRKIKKKYGEWIVEVNKMPKRPIGAEIITLRTMDDIIKTSEELGKPIIHYRSESDNTHIFYVLDDSVHYQYLYSENEKLKKSVRCPQCQTRIETEGLPGEIIRVQCPKCGKKGTVEI